MIVGLPLVLGMALSPPPPRPGSWSTGVGLRPALSAGGTGVGFQTMYRYRFTPNVALDTLGRSNLSWANAAGDADQFYLALGAGVAWQQAESVYQWAWRTSARFTHVHHASTDSWLDTPGANVAGDSSGGVAHRSGAEWAVGVIAPKMTDLWGQHLRWEIEAQVNTLPSSDHFVWAAGLTIGLVIDSVENDP